MSQINYRYREIALRIAYCGPGLSGSTTNFNCIHTAHNKYCKGDIIALDTKKYGTLISNFSLMKLGQIEGYTSHFSMYEDRWRVLQKANSCMILEGTDDTVLVSDSLTTGLDTSLDSCGRLRNSHIGFGVDWRCFRHVLEYFKCGRSKTLHYGPSEDQPDQKRIPTFEAVASKGRQDTDDGRTKQTLVSCIKNRVR